MGPCLTDDAIFQFVQGRSALIDRSGVNAHIAECTDCRRIIAEVARRTYASDASEAFEEPTELDRPARGRQRQPDRYELIDPIGAGGMGVVYRARDTALDRAVAVKVILGKRRDEQRLLREARAMAQVSHANVAAVYDVGLLRGRVFIAMELVDGETLRQWIEPRRDWRELVPLFIEAARGLAAIHDAGLVHRDFKPENVLIGRDGRVKVSDFGLALLTSTGSIEGVDAAEVASVIDGNAAIMQRLTATGALAGTPVYMAPEQLTGRGIDARADQFSFCVSLAEALCERRPSLLGLTTAIDGEEAGPHRTDSIRLPARSDAPRALERILRLGLAHDPGDRFPSMAALIDEIERAMRPRRRAAVWVVAAAGAAGAAAAVAAALMTWGPGEREPASRPAAGAASATTVTAAPAAAGAPHSTQPDAPASAQPDAPTAAAPASAAQPDAPPAAGPAPSGSLARAHTRTAGHAGASRTRSSRQNHGRARQAAERPKLLPPDAAAPPPDDDAPITNPWKPRR